ncbi:MAG: ABC transporter permease subunit [Candidatus Eisenbacteria bacterium]|nr:ABC transporter permease subunit [Candidatus Eisenbacteria bacterium]
MRSEGLPAAMARVEGRSGAMGTDARRQERPADTGGNGVKIWYLARREMAMAFRTPLGYVLLLVYALIAGFVFVLLLMRFQVISTEALQSPYRTADLVIPLTAENWLVQPYLSNIAQVLIFFIPFLTMSSIAGERRTGGLELLLSYPMSTAQIIIGKFLGVFLVYGCLIGINVFHILLLSLFRDPGWGTVLTGLLGLLFMGASLTALGVFISSLSQGALEAALLTLGVVAGLALAGGSEAAEGWRAVVRFISPLGHWNELSGGVLRLDPLLAYAAGCVAALALALRGLDWVRWRGVGS